MTSAQVPVRRLARDCRGRSVIWPVSSKWCLARKLRTRSKVERGQGEAEHDGHLGDAHNPHEATAEIGEGAIEGGVDRLDDLAPAHGDAPRRGAVGDALPPGHLGRRGG